MSRIVAVLASGQIFPRYRNTPIGRLIEYHNLHRPAPFYSRAELLISVCMDNRTTLHLPENFAYTIRTAAGNLRQNEFRTSYAIGVGGVRAIALVAHTDCGMVHLTRHRDRFIDGMVRNAGWSAEQAAVYFDQSAPTFDIANEVDFIVAEAQRVRALYPKVLVAPLLFRVETRTLCLIEE